MAAKKRKRAKRHKVGRRKKKATWANMLPPLPKGKLIVMDPRTPSGFRPATSEEIRNQQRKKG
jgi:hypothetical protein